MQEEAGRSASIFLLALLDFTSHHENVPGLARKHPDQTKRTHAPERHVAGDPVVPTKAIGQ